MPLVEPVHCQSVNNWVYVFNHLVKFRTCFEKCLMENSRQAQLLPQETVINSRQCSYISVTFKSSSWQVM